jgi:hypothetical protein
MSHKRSPAACEMDLAASLRLGFPSVQYVVNQLRRKTCGPPCIQAHPPRLGYELCETCRLKRRLIPL